MLVIHYSGPACQRAKPRSVDALIEVLQREPLDPSFEKFGNFLIISPLRVAVFVGRGQYQDGAYVYPKHPDAVRFFGNFWRVSHAFCVDTDELKIIARLTEAIRDNQRTPAYQAARKAAA